MQFLYIVVYQINEMVFIDFDKQFFDVVIK